MNRTLRHLALGVSAGTMVFAIVVPVTHLLVELASSAGVAIGPWNNPVEIFIFLMTAAMVGMFPWGLWIILTDARRVEMFDEVREVTVYLVAGVGVYLIMTLLVCTRLQPLYAQLRWLFTPALLLCAAALMYWRWKRVWGFPTNIGLRDALEYGLDLKRDS